MEPPGKRHKPDSSAVAATGSSAAVRLPPPLSREMTEEILSRLPVTSVLRFKMVSRQWRAFASEPNFIRQHLARSRFPPLLIIHFVTASANNPEDLNLHRHILQRYVPPEPISAIAQIRRHPGSEVDGPQNLEVIGTTPSGIVCVAQGPQATTLTLWNPATQSTRVIPPPLFQPADPADEVNIGLAYDPAQEDYIIIRIIDLPNEEEPDVAEIFSLRTGVWTPVDQPNFPFWVFGPTCAAVINGVPFWRCVTVPILQFEDNMSYMYMLLSFNVNNRLFEVEPLPWASDGNKLFFLGEIRRGFLGAIVWNRDGLPFHVFDVWVREEANDWSRVYRDRQLGVQLGVQLEVTEEVAGFYGNSSGIVLENVSQRTLRMLSVMNMATRDLRRFENEAVIVMEGFKLVSYRESLVPVPEIGNAAAIA